eukprot:scaffold289291_cov35-Attheya_sp.AAC.1
MATLVIPSAQRLRQPGCSYGPTCKLPPNALDLCGKDGCSMLLHRICQNKYGEENNCCYVMTLRCRQCLVEEVEECHRTAPSSNENNFPKKRHSAYKLTKRPKCPTSSLRLPLLDITRHTSTGTKSATNVHVSEATGTIPTSASTTSTVFSPVSKATATSSRSARVRVRADTFDTAILSKVSCSLLATFNAFPTALESAFSTPKQKQREKRATTASGPGTIRK